MLRLSMLASTIVGILAAGMAWKMQDIIGVLQLGFTINGAALFLPTMAAFYWRGADSTAAFWSICLSLATVLGWRLASDADAGAIFSIDPLWPGLLVSVIVFLSLSRLRNRSAPSAS